MTLRWAVQWPNKPCNKYYLAAFVLPGPAICFCVSYHGYCSKSFANFSERRLHPRLNIARHFFYTCPRVPHARHACLVLDFPEPNCDWSKKNDVMEIVCGFVFADVIFRRRDTKAGNTSVFAGYCMSRQFVLCSIRERRVALRGNRLSCPRG